MKRNSNYEEYQMSKARIQKPTETFTKREKRESCSPNSSILFKKYIFKNNSTSKKPRITKLKNIQIQSNNREESQNSKTSHTNKKKQEKDTLLKVINNTKKNFKIEVSDFPPKKNQRRVSFESNTSNSLVSNPFKNNTSNSASNLRIETKLQKSPKNIQTREFRYSLNPENQKINGILKKKNNVRFKNSQSVTDLGHEIRSRNFQERISVNCDNLDEKYFCLKNKFNCIRKDFNENEESSRENKRSKRMIFEDNSSKEATPHVSEQIIKRLNNLNKEEDSSDKGNLNNDDFQEEMINSENSSTQGVQNQLLKYYKTPMTKNKMSKIDNCNSELSNQRDIMSNVSKGIGISMPSETFKVIENGDRRMRSRESKTRIFEDGPEVVHKQIENIKRDMEKAENSEKKLLQKMQIITFLEKDDEKNSKFKEFLPEYVEKLRKKEANLLKERKRQEEDFNFLEARIKELRKEKQKREKLYEILKSKENLYFQYDHEVVDMLEQIHSLKKHINEDKEYISITKHSMIQKVEKEIRKQCEIRAMEVAFERAPCWDDEIRQLKMRIEYLREKKEVLKEEGMEIQEGVQFGGYFTMNEQFRGESSQTQKFENFD